jgi:phosphate transport system permease protein
MSVLMVGLTCAAAALAIVPLVAILAYLLEKGASALSLDFFTNMPRPVGEVGGGMANAIVGTLILIGIASAVGLPVGIGAGLYLAERGSTRLANLVRFLADVLNGLPSIVMGIFAWQFLVRPFGRCSASAGGGHSGCGVGVTVAVTVGLPVGVAETDGYGDGITETTTVGPAVTTIVGKAITESDATIASGSAVDET